MTSASPESKAQRANRRVESVDAVLLDELQKRNKSGHRRVVAHLEYPDGWDFVVRDLRLTAVSGTSCGWISTQTRRSFGPRRAGC
jgi:hypothetical protein